MVLNLLAGEDSLDREEIMDLTYAEKKAPLSQLSLYLPQFCKYLEMERNIHKREIKSFMLNRAERDIAFAHEVLWYYLSQLNEGNEEIGY